MSNAKLLAITVERFKSFAQSTRIELAPLTIILGRNNSGKSTLIQRLLLLKQTLRDVNPEVMLRLDGTVDAFNLRELTFGWPAADDPKPGLEEGPRTDTRPHHHRRMGMRRRHQECYRSAARRRSGQPRKAFGDRLARVPAGSRRASNRDDAQDRGHRRHGERRRRHRPSWA